MANQFGDHRATYADLARGDLEGRLAAAIHRTLDEVMAARPEPNEIHARKLFKEEGRDTSKDVGIMSGEGPGLDAAIKELEDAGLVTQVSEPILDTDRLAAATSAAKKWEECALHLARKNDQLERQAAEAKEASAQGIRYYRHDIERLTAQLRIANEGAAAAKKWREDNERLREENAGLRAGQWTGPLATDRDANGDVIGPHRLQAMTRLLELYRALGDPAQLKHALNVRSERERRLEWLVSRIEHLRGNASLKTGGREREVLSQLLGVKDVVDTTRSVIEMIDDSRRIGR